MNYSRLTGIEMKANREVTSDVLRAGLIKVPYFRRDGLMCVLLDLDQETPQWVSLDISIVSFIDSKGSDIDIPSTNPWSPLYELR